MKKQPERTARTKQALKDAFWKLYSEKPIEKITVREITDNAGVYRSTFYEYYSDVYAVLEAIEHDVMASHRTFIHHVSEIKTIPEGMKLIMEFYTVNSKYLAILLGPDGDPAFLRRIKQEIHSELKNLFNIETGDLEIDLSIELTASYVITILTYWYEHQEEYTVSELIEVGSKFLQHGLLPVLKKYGLKIEL